MTDTLRAALYTIPASCDRGTWWQLAAALKTELGEAGFTLFDAWSQAAPDKYDRSTTASTWRSVHAGRFTIGTVYHLARENGWHGQEPVPREPTPEEKRRSAERRQREERRRRAVEERQAKKAAHILSLCEYTTHPYLARKGFPDAKGLVHDGDLIIPMRHYRTNAIQSYQAIRPDGSKRFLAGGRASWAVFRLRDRQPYWYVEGYATGLSVKEALGYLYRHDQVVVCFSAGNIPKVSLSSRRSMVIADNDESGAGERAAQQTGLPYWMPPEPGTDANDFALEHGIGRLAVELRGICDDKPS